jgi:hypothetical protein
MIEVPGLGILEKDEQFDDLLCSSPINVNVLGNIECKLLLEAYEEDENKEDYHEAINNFLKLDESALAMAQEHIYQYYKDILGYLTPEDEWYVEIDKPEDVWKHIQFGVEPVIARRDYGDKEVYVSLECSCDWEQEHGLQIVLKNGSVVNKVGPYDGHLTNSDAYDDESLENVIYK